MSWSQIEPIGRARARAAATATFALFLLLLPLLSGNLRASIGADARLRAGNWIVVRVDQDSIASSAGLQLGDQVIGPADGSAIHDRRTDPGIDFTAADEWLVARQSRQVDVELASGDTWLASLEPVLMLLIGLGFWSVATYVWLRQPNDELRGRLFRVSLAMAAALALSPAADNDLPWAKILNVLAFVSLPAEFFGFSLALCDVPPTAQRWRVVVFVLWCLGLLSGAAYLFAGFRGLAWYDLARMPILALLAVSFLGGLVVLVRAYRHPEANRARPRSLIALLGLAAAILPITVFSLIPESLGQPSLIRPQFAALSLLLLPVSFALAIRRHELFDAGIAIRRTLVYGATSLVLASLYALLFLTFEAAAVRLAPGRPIGLLVLFFVGITLTFTAARDHVRSLVDRAVFHDRYDPAETFRTLLIQLGAIRPIDEALSNVTVKLVQAMNLRGAAVFLERDDGEVMLRGPVGEYLGISDAARYLARNGPGDPAAILGGDSGYWVPLVVHGRQTGVLYLAPKCTRAEFSPDDLHLAEVVAGQAGAVVANALLVEQLQAKAAELELLRDRLLRVEQSERKRLARELHDGPLHLVLDIVRQAVTMKEALALDGMASPEIQTCLRGLAERGSDVAYELRAICTDLYPAELAHLGLPATLDDLARRVSQEENLEVTFGVSGFPLDLRLPERTEDALYRIAREALDNAHRHGQARHASVRLEATPDGVCLRVRDDGRGFAPPRPSSALVRTGHLGLATMRERAEQVGGRFVLSTAPGAGTEISVHVADPIIVESLAELAAGSVG